MTEEGYLLIGTVIGAHGIKGFLKVRSYAESLSVFEPDNDVLLSDSANRKKTFTVRGASPHKRGVLLSLAGIDTREQAESLVGADFLIAKDTLPELAEDTYYWSDLIGLSVYTVDDVYLGDITEIIPTGSNDVYVVRERDREILIPALVDVVREVRLAEKRMRVDLPEGLGP